jgi:hypothetical protein
MNLFLKLYDKELQKYLLYFALFFWAILASILILVRRDSLVVVKVDDFGTTVLTEGSDKLVTVETENFINNFIAYFYNYTSDNYDNHIEKSFDFLSRKVSEKYVSKLNSTSDKIKLKRTQQSAFARKITKIKDGIFEIDLVVDRRNESEELTDEYKIRIELDRDRRSLENPYGLVISDLEEIYE